MAARAGRSGGRWSSQYLGCPSAGIAIAKLSSTEALTVALIARRRTASASVWGRTVCPFLSYGAARRSPPRALLGPADGGL